MKAFDSTGLVSKVKLLEKIESSERLNGFSYRRLLKCKIKYSMGC
jgi:hypothetical protein